MSSKSAKNAQPEPEDEINVALVTTAPDDWEFDVIHDESPTRILFDVYGDSFVGQYKGIEHIEQPPDDKGNDMSFDLYVFTARDDKPYSINKSYQMEQAMAKVNGGEWCRITYVKDIPSKKGNPLKDLRVEVRKN